MVNFCGGLLCYSDSGHLQNKINMLTLEAERQAGELAQKMNGGQLLKFQQAIHKKRDKPRAYTAEDIKRLANKIIKKYGRNNQLIIDSINRVKKDIYEIDRKKRDKEILKEAVEAVAREICFRLSIKSDKFKSKEFLNDCGYSEKINN